jgi:general secretion pathway protein A
MYEQFFDLKRRPFGATPDPTTYFPAPGHEEALALMRSCVEERDGLGVLIGPPGSGKTLLCRLLAQSLDRSHHAVFLCNTHMASVESMIQAILYDLALPIEGLREQELRLRLIDFIMEKFNGGGRTLLLIDEAQNLSEDQLEELRLLTNLEGRSDKAVQAMLFGLGSLAVSLQAPAMEAFRQRVAVVARLRPLDEDEVVEYVRRQIAGAGGSCEDIFTAHALSEVCEHSRGIPRRVNQLCHRAMLLAFAHESGTVDAQYVHAAAEQLRLPTAEPELHHSDSAIGGRPAADYLHAHEEERSVPTVIEVGAEEPAPGDSRDAASPSGQTVIDPEASPSPERPIGISRLHRLYSR